MENQNQQDQNNLKEVQHETTFQPLSEEEQASITGGHLNTANMEDITVDSHETEKSHNCPPGHIWKSELNTCVGHELIDGHTHGIFTGAVTK